MNPITPFQSLRLKLHLLILIFSYSMSAARSEELISFENYKTLTCKGEMPECLKNKLHSFKYSSKDHLSLEQRNRLKEDILLQNVLFKNQILYGDALSEYVSNVADNALSSDPKLRKQLHFFVIKSSGVNAFITENGFAFVTVGLLSQIENEAQLALIICHEASHFRDKHSMQKNVRTNKLSIGKSSVNADERLKSMISFSKELELQADYEGFVLLLKSKYTTAHAETVFDMMKYSHLPYEKLTMSTNYFDESGYVIPTRYFLEKTDEYKRFYFKDTFFNTHPDIDIRKEKLSRHIDITEANQGFEYFKSKDHFEYIRKIARYELPLCNISNGDFIPAFYNTFLLEKIYGANAFTDGVKAHLYYIMALIKNSETKDSLRYVNRQKYETLGYTWRLQSGASQNLFHLVYTMPAKEFNILALKKLYTYSQTYKSDYYRMRTRQLFKQLVSIHKMKKSDFYIPDASDSGKSGKSQQIELEKRNQELDYYNFAFMKVFDEMEFKVYFNKAMDDYDNYQSMISRPNYVKYTKEKDKIIKQYGPALNTRQVTFINPELQCYESNFVMFDTFYYRILVNDPEYTPIDIQSYSKAYSEALFKYGDQLGMNIGILGKLYSDSMKTEEFNRYQYINKWTMEVVNQSVNALTYFSTDSMDNFPENLGYLSIRIIDKELNITFVLIDSELNSFKYIYTRDLSNIKPEDIRIRACIYELLDHVSQSPDKINQLKAQYEIHE